MNPALRHVPQGSNNTSEKAIVAETGRQRAQIQYRQLQCLSNPFKEDKSSTTAGASSTGAGVSSSGAGASSPGADESSTETGVSSAGTGTSSPGTGDISSGTTTPSSEAGTPPQAAGVLSSSGATPFISSGVSPTASPGVAPDVPHHETATTRPNPSAGETNSTNAKGASGVDLSTAYVDFARIDRDPFQASEEEYRVLKTPPGVAEASASGIIGASAKPSPSEVDEPTPSVPPGVAPAACELCLTHASTRVELNTKANRQLKKDQAPMTTYVQPQAKPHGKNRGFNTGRQRDTCDIRHVHVQQCVPLDHATDQGSLPLSATVSEFPSLSLEYYVDMMACRGSVRTMRTPQAR